ncbi:glucose/galactose MFS transporter, partial [Sphingomonas sp. DT-204]
MPAAFGSTNTLPGAASTGATYAGALRLLATLFFMWGFITVINNTLLPHLRSV